MKIELKRLSQRLGVGVLLFGALWGCGGGGGGGESGGGGGGSRPAATDVDDYSGDLGVTYEGDAPTVRLWAPTASNVQMRLYDTSTTSAYEAVDMSFDETTGVWTAAGDASWTGKYYLFRLNGQSVTDPYSVSLSTDSKRSQIINLDAAALKPAGWDTLTKPTLSSFSDIVIYELHVRDFSANDASVAADKKGKFVAFAEPNSFGVQHLKRLKAAGVTHIHLLPAFDIASVIEDESKRKEPGITSGSGASTGPAAKVSAVKDSDAFNWGYDPFHYGVPEGSYATDPDGAQRILEFRQMVKAINAMGLRVVMDVVYNHTSANGATDSRSVFDKIVSGYYYRGTNASCCPDTATEKPMMEKIMIDTMVRWARDYKVDGFRFDLMGFHTKQNLLNVRSAMDALTVAKDGVDGKKIYVYGEGWDFGGLSGKPGVTNASQINMGGTGIGTFNDRLRDAIRGGGPFSGYRVQGFSNADSYSGDQLLHYSDHVRLGLAGNLKDVTFVDKDGKTTTGFGLSYNGNAPAGYGVVPTDVINYASAHDNETLFDAVQVKAGGSVSIGDRVRMVVLAESIVALAQGIPFFHAGDELLRSKSLDRNSYNSGDWFNRMDFTYMTNNWAVGLPPNTEGNETVMTSLLKDASIAPNAAHIQFALARFEEFLKIRKSSRLFRLETANDIKSRIKFYNTGKAQTPGLVVMSIDDEVGGGSDLDPIYSRAVVVVNATSSSQSYSNMSAPWMGATLKLHACQLNSSDSITQQSQFSAGTFTVPARTTAVFVQTQAGQTSVCGSF